MALTKTTAVDTVDAWQAVTAGTLVAGTAKDVSGSYSTILTIEAAIIEAVANAGYTIYVEISYTDNDWAAIAEFDGTSDTPATTTINDGAVTAADTSLTLTDATTGDFDVPGRLWLIKDGTIANSEVVRTVVNAVHTVTIADGLLRNHANGLSVYDFAEQWVIAIPFAAAQVRVVVYNEDADSDIMFTSRVSMVTAIS